ncbi:hypothetical protein DY000_02055278 [Brassica cretica]|uniref:Uncharacterized protein n=1 Tax=Brassica cretica TaxID=69181 RepID=A0ABQ7AHM5_BRACR|nr:hypothetical protein DY000_02055278 [Brassica cretica]
MDALGGKAIKQQGSCGTGQGSGLVKGTHLLQSVSLRRKRRQGSGGVLQLGGESVGY